ncbi:MAG: sensor histidine kinase [Pseudomonadota bacterium]
MLFHARGATGNVLSPIATIAARWLGVLCFAILVHFCAFAEPFDVADPPHYKILADAEFVREDLTQLSLEEAITRYRAGDFSLAKTSTGDPTRPNNPESINLIYGPAWVRLAVTNTSDTAISARLDARAGILNNVLNAYIVRGDGGSEMIWRNNWLDEPHAVQWPRMRLRASSDFSLAPSEEVELWIDYPYGFMLGEELWLINEHDFVARRTGDAGYSSFLFGWRAALIVAVLAFAIILRSRVAAFYAMFSTALFAFFLENYGFTYTYVFKSYAVDQVFFVGSGGVAFTFFGLMSREFLSAPRLYPQLNKALLWTMILGWGACLTAMFLGPHPATFMILTPFILVFTGICIYAAIIGVRNQHKGSSLYLIATLMLFANCFFGLLAWPPFYLVSARLNADVTHLGFSIDAFLFAGALALQALALREERDSAYEAEIAALSEKASITSALDTMTTQHDHAIALAEARRRALAETTHDLKQPLLSLQMSLRDKQDVEALSQGVSYLQSVVDKTLDDVRADRNDHVEHAFIVDRTANLDDIIGNIALMFSDEAHDKGIDLRTVRSSIVVKAEPVILMRILINLVANAIKHTVSGRILIGARRRGDAAMIEVYDTGPGMSERDLQDAFKPYVSGTASTGEGLGLAIVKELANESGLDIHAHSQPGKGTVFRIVGLSRGN